MFEPQEEFISVGPERLRGEAKARFSFPRRGRIMDRQQQASWQLNKALSNFEGFGEEARLSLQEEFIRLPSLKVMNMEALAATLAFLRAFPQPSPQSFQDNNILPFINKVLPPDLKGSEKQRAITRYKTQILRYVRAVSDFRARY